MPDGERPHFLSFFDNMEIPGEINEVFSSSREFTMREAHINPPLPSGDIDRKFTEGKIFKVPMPGDEHVIGVLSDKTDIMRAVS